MSDQNLTPFLRNCTNLRNLLVGDWFFDATTGDTFSDVIGEWSFTPWSDDPNAGSSTEEQFWAQLAALVLRNPSLECVMLHFRWDCGPTAEFLRALGSCPQMKKYESVKCVYDDIEQIQALMSILCRLEKVAFRWDTFDPLPDCWKFLKVKQLTLQSIHTPDLEDIIEARKIDMVCSCPNLRTLNWAVGMYCPFPIEEFCDRVPAACPNLRQLSFDYDLAFYADYGKLDIIRQSFKGRVITSLGRERHYREPYTRLAW
ncbi:hypothetical protein BGZ75_000552 [Mortierella antarctica]|nr:hypothetical protein BGZ75_000552 [Mortierella antarctica]